MILYASRNPLTSLVKLWKESFQEHRGAVMSDGNSSGTLASGEPA